MAVRIKDGMIPYTGGQGIEITNNHVINVLLRELNNLIEVNEDRELYVDLQLPDGIEPDDDFPVGVTTGKILQEDGWQDSGIILNWKTTSGDYVRLIYANDGKLYYDPGTGIWIEIGSGGGGQSIGVATASTLGTVKLGSDTVQTEPAQTPSSDYGKTFPVQLNSSNQAVVNVPYPEYSSLVEENGGTDESLVTTGEKYIWNHKQDQLTAGTRITIQNGVISADISGVLTYKGNVNTVADLPSSGQTVGDTYFVEGADAMYSWDGTQWNYVGGTGIDLTNYFNKSTDDSDDIVQGSTHLFVSTAEKNRWDGKQDALIAGENITISNQNVISSTSYTEGEGIDITSHVVTNTLPFKPENTGTLSQVLKKTSTGYRWADESGGGGGGGSSYTAGDGISISNHVISNTKPFEPTNNGQMGQILKKTANGYIWATESTGEGNVKLFTMSNTTDTTTVQSAIDWLNAGKLPILKCSATFGYTQITGHYYFYPVQDSTSTSTNLIFQAIPTSNNSYILPNGKVRRYRPIITVELDLNGDVDNITVTTAEAEREDITRTWVGTQAEYNLLTPETGVIYNIIPSS